MRFMVMVKATEGTEAGELPKTEDFAAMLAFNEELVKAGILLTADGLKPSSAGARVRFSGNERTVIDGPFTETKELVAGYWIIEVGSKEEAIEWFKRCPNPAPGQETEIEIRPFHEPEDFGDAYTPELQAVADRLEATVAEQRG
ncbi:YciI family protein [Nocardia stercoris]|uniref:YciI family protein n=1 Tax=Nocardia stercoris TaxID=2483361 RepID=A0A3M2L3K2_9NOCA|nr:YciI family protein [Nocardia stercoris]RMI31280.1 YciI family protein [Nocardia stercoris]